jgi:hypothetical protein
MPTWYERNKESISQKNKERWANDPEYRQRVKDKTDAWRKANPDRVQEYRKGWETRTPEYTMYHNAKRRARYESIPFDISFTDIVIPDTCPVLGTKFDTSNRETSPSLDRIIPHLGYVKGNISVISMRANRLKSDATEQELRQIANYIKESGS